MKQGWSNTELESIFQHCKVQGVEALDQLGSALKREPSEIESIVNQFTGILLSPKSNLGDFMEATTMHQTQIQHPGMSSVGIVATQLPTDMEPGAENTLEAHSISNQDPTGSDSLGSVTTGLHPVPTIQSAEIPKKRKRGRPPKKTGNELTGEKRPRGRPRGSRSKKNIKSENAVLEQQRRTSARAQLKSSKVRHERNLLRTQLDETDVQNILLETTDEPTVLDSSFVCSTDLPLESRKYMGRFTRESVAENLRSSGIPSTSGTSTSLIARKTNSINQRGEQKIGSISKQLVEQLKQSTAGRKALEFVRAMDNASFRRWCTYQHFYSPHDAMFFGDNKFASMLEQLRGKGIALDDKVRLTRSEWGLVRAAMLDGKRTRRFSSRFIQEQRNMLNIHRKVQDSSMMNSNSYMMKYKVGDVVTAIRPVVFEIATGIILSVDTSTGKILVQFLNPEFGTHPVELNNICPCSGSNGHEFGDSWTKKLNANGFGVSVPIGMLDYHSRTNHSIYRFDDVQQISTSKLDPSEDVAGIVCQTMNLIDQKQLLLEELSQMNGVGATLKKLRGGQTLPERFAQQYAWIISRLHTVNSNLGSCLTLLRPGVLGETVSDNESKLSRFGNLSKLEQRASFAARWIRNGNTLTNGISATLSQELELLDSSEISRLATLQERLNSRGLDNSRNLSTCASALLLALRHCAESNIEPSLLDDVVGSVLELLTPQYSSNENKFKEIKAYVALLQSRCVDRLK